MIASSIRCLVTLLLLVSWQSMAASAYGNQLVTIPAAGGTPKKLVIEPSTHCGSPCWSPDGKWIAYDAAGSSRQVYVVRMNDEEPKQLDFDGHVIDLSQALPDEPLRAYAVGEDAGMPSWSPDGKQLAWHTYRPGSVVVGDFSVRREKESNSPVVSVSPLVRVVNHWGNPVWFRNANRLLTIRGREFSVYDPQTDRESTFYRLPNGYPHWGYSISPDGKRIAYCRNGALRIAGVGDNKEPDRRRLAPSVGYSSWSPDGKQLVVSRILEGQSKRKLFILDVDSDEPPRLIDGQDPSAGYAQPNWSPDGKTIVCVQLN